MKNLFFTLALATVIGPFSLTASATPKAEAFTDKRPIYLTFFIHDDVPHLKHGALKSDYIDWFVDELKHISGREFDISFVHGAPGYNDFDYKSQDLKGTLAEWSTRTWEFMKNEHGSTEIRPKYILITGEDINATVGGVAYDRGRAAIASLSSYRNIAHEVGHLLGGTHENAEVRWKGLWKCESNLYWGLYKTNANCYEYSQKNREAIAAYLSEQP